MTDPLVDHDTIDEAYVPEQSPSVFTVTIDGEAVLLDEVEERLHHLNAPAALVWACLDGHASVAELATELSDELDVPRATVLDETLVVLRDLGAQGLLRGVRAVPDDGES